MREALNLFSLIVSSAGIGYAFSDILTPLGAASLSACIACGVVTLYRGRDNT